MTTMVYNLPVVLFLIWPICCAKWCLRSLTTISLQCLLESKQDFFCSFRFHQQRRGVRSGVQLNCTETRFQKCCQRKQYKTIKKLLSLETPAPPQGPRCEVPRDKFWDQNFPVKVVLRPLRPKRGILHPITIRIVRFRQNIFLAEDTFNASKFRI